LRAVREIRGSSNNTLWEMDFWEGEATDLHNFGYVTPSGCRRFFRAASRTFWTEV
jgi:hypothetical protein